jgi:hypothetical protein
MMLRKAVFSKIKSELWIPNSENIKHHSLACFTDIINKLDLTDEKLLLLTYISKGVPDVS